MKKTRGAEIEEGASAFERLFLAGCEANGLPAPVPEFPFAQEIGRKWRMDFLFEGWLALEVQGGNWKGGRHTRAAELLGEYEKLNWAVILGFSTLLCTPRQIQDGSIFPIIKMALAKSQEAS